ncbi:Phage gp6-like head-tail connector protein, partial [Streptococcus pyogenes GA06023]
MAVSKELLDSVKLYCKIDFDFEDDIIKEMIESAQEQICFAIEEGSTADTFKERSWV